MEFTGEYFIPGKVEPRIEQDHLARYAFAKGYVQNAHVLDIACGVGYGSVPILEGEAESYTGVDINESLIQYARNIYGSGKVNFTVGDIISYNEGSYDIITCFETIEHIQDFSFALKNLYRLLKSNGTLIISSPNRLITSPNSLNIYDIPANKFHTHEFIPVELKNILKSLGFTTQRLYGQRQRIWIPNKYLRFRYNKYFNPDYRKTAIVNPVRLLTPRYFVIVANKNL